MVTNYPYFLQEFFGGWGGTYCINTVCYNISFIEYAASSYDERLAA